MPDVQAIVLFMAAALALLVIPGPAVGYVVAQSVARGARVGIAASAGNVTGGVLHVLMAMLGLASLIIRFPAAYEILRFGGAGYLIWLGIQRLLPAKTEPQTESPAGSGMRSAYLGGIVVNATNPKGILFFGAFLPQFLRPEAGHVVTQIAILGAIFLVMAFVSDSTYALLASRIYPLVRDRARQQRARIAGGLLYISLGIAAALLRRR